MTLQARKATKRLVTALKLRHIHVFAVLHRSVELVERYIEACRHICIDRCNFSDKLVGCSCLDIAECKRISHPACILHSIVLTYPPVYKLAVVIQIIAAVICAVHLCVADVDALVAGLAGICKLSHTCALAGSHGNALANGNGVHKELASGTGYVKIENSELISNTAS